MKRVLFLALVFCLLLSACMPKPEQTQAPTGAPVDTDFAQTDEQMFTQRDCEGAYSENYTIYVGEQSGTFAAN